MKKLKVGILSGKGGVGKTSLTASLLSLARDDPEVDPMVLDCDVDAPNLSLILPALSKEKIHSTNVYATYKASLDDSICTQCKKCVDEHFCEFNALKWDEKSGYPVIDYLACEGCAACKVLCPVHAFDVNPVKSGEIISYPIKNNSDLVYGETRLGSTTSGKLVTDVKDYSQQLKNYGNYNLVLIDGPPGIGCPVIAMVTGLDYIITITEPTPSGLHDLMRAIEVINQFKIPFGIVLNKANIESDFIEEFQKFIENTGYSVLGKIDFDLAIPEAMSHAKPVVDHAPNSKASLAIKKIYLKLKSILWNHDQAQSR